MPRKTIAPTLDTILADLEGLCSIVKPPRLGREQAAVYRTARRELRRMKRALTLAGDLLHGVDGLMNEEPLVSWRGRGYMVEKSAALRSALARLSSSTRGRDEAEREGR